MALPIGTWSIDANGHEGQLEITGVDFNGKLSGNAFGDSIEGFWNDTAQKITFLRMPVPDQPNTTQIYTGYLFKNRPSLYTKYTLTGYFEAFQGGGGSPPRSLFGWLAQIDVPPELPR